jgi:elongation factor Ts
MQSRVTVIEAYGHNGRVGVLVELELDTEFTGQMQGVKQLARDVAVQVAALNPKSVSALLHSEFVKNPAISLGEHIHTVGTQLGERIAVSRFVRWDNELEKAPPSHSPDPPEDPALAKRA